MITCPIASATILVDILPKVRPRTNCRDLLKSWEGLLGSAAIVNSHKFEMVLRADIGNCAGVFENMPGKKSMATQDVNLLI